MAKKSPSINLLRDNSGNFIDKFVTWALSAGRVIVIITELIALSAFLYRFSLDRQLIDIHTKIRQEQAVITYLKDNEQTYRNLQNRLLLASNFSKQGKDKVDILKQIIGFAPQGITFNNVALQADRARIDANSTSVASLSEFVNSLKNYSRVSSIIIEKIENRSSSASISVSITALLKQQL